MLQIWQYCGNSKFSVVRKRIEMLYKQLNNPVVIFDKYYQEQAVRRRVYNHTNASEIKIILRISTRRPIICANNSKATKKA